MFIFYALLPYVCFPFLPWVKFCSGCFRQVFYSLVRQKKVIAGHVRQVVVLYSHDFIGISLDGLSIGRLRRVII